MSCLGKGRFKIIILCIKIKLLNANKSNTVLFYATTEEAYNIIPKEILIKIVVL
jgi:hypothetical protein